MARSYMSSYSGRFCELPQIRENPRFLGDSFGSGGEARSPDLTIMSRAESESLECLSCHLRPVEVGVRE